MSGSASPAVAGAGVRRAGLLGRPVSLELSPGEVESFDPDPAVFPAGSRVFLSHIEGKPLAAQAEAARVLTERGFVAVPHLGARNLESAAAYVAQIERLSASGVTEALFVGGNPSTPWGPFSEAADLLAHPVLASSSIRKAYLAAHPEGHPAVDAATLAAAFARKLALCAERGITPAAATQFGFDGPQLGAWAREFAADHPAMELRIGLAGVTSLPKLIRFAVRCGVGPSLSVLRKSPGSLLTIAAERDPGDLIAAIDGAGLADDASVHAHFFVFGGWKKTLDWLARRG